MAERTTLNEGVISLAERRERLQKPNAPARPKFEMPCVGLRIGQIAPDGQRYYYFPDPEANKRFVDALMQDAARLSLRKPTP